MLAQKSTWAYYFSHITNRVPICRCCSNVTAEWTQWLGSLHLPGREIFLCSDSQTLRHQVSILRMNKRKESENDNAFPVCCICEGANTKQWLQINLPNCYDAADFTILCGTCILVLIKPVKKNAIKEFNLLIWMKAPGVHTAETLVLG